MLTMCNIYSVHVYRPRGPGHPTLLRHVPGYILSWGTWTPYTGVPCPRVHSVLGDLDTLHWCAMSQGTFCPGGPGHPTLVRHVPGYILSWGTWTPYTGAPCPRVHSVLGDLDTLHWCAMSQGTFCPGGPGHPTLVRHVPGYILSWGTWTPYTGAPCPRVHSVLGDLDTLHWCAMSQGTFCPGGPGHPTLVRHVPGYILSWGTWTPYTGAPCPRVHSVLGDLDTLHWCAMSQGTFCPGGPGHPTLVRHVPGYILSWGTWTPYTGAPCPRVHSVLGDLDTLHWCAVSQGTFCPGDLDTLHWCAMSQGTFCPGGHLHCSNTTRLWFPVKVMFVLGWSNLSVSANACVLTRVAFLR